jgi:hypothetical protein
MRRVNRTNTPLHDGSGTWVFRFGIAFGPLREGDLAAQRVLRERFLAHLTDEELCPRIAPLLLP